MSQPLDPSDPQRSLRIIATGTTCPRENLEAACALLRQWGFVPHVADTFFAPDPLFIAPDGLRFSNLKEALYDDEISLIWALRGGYGTARLLMDLVPLDPPKTTKTLIGFSDVTALHLFVSQRWGWKTIHGPTLNGFTHSISKVPFSPDPQERAMHQNMKALLTTGKTSADHHLLPLNRHAKALQELRAHLRGGNLALCQRSIATPWALEANQGILFFEDVNESPHRLSAMLDHLIFAGTFETARAIVFGNFTQDEEPGAPGTDPQDGLVAHVLQEFAARQSIPVFKGLPVGHRHVNFPVQINAPVTLRQDAAGLFHFHQELAL